MSYLDGLHLVPAHMRESISTWIDRGLPHPQLLGHFLRALLSNDLMGAFAHADSENTAAMKGWTLFLYNYAPSTCHGSMARLEEWHQCHRVIERAEQ